MKQREFPWMVALSAPKQADQRLVLQCQSYGMAARVSIRLKCGSFTESWLRQRLGLKSRGYFSDLLNDKAPMPRWMLKPIAWATGSALILQYDDLQRGIRIAKGETQHDLIERLVAQAVAA